jgi:hypothetical protein
MTYCTRLFVLALALPLVAGFASPVWAEADQGVAGAGLKDSMDLTGLADEEAEAMATEMRGLLAELKKGTHKPKYTDPLKQGMVELNAMKHLMLYLGTANKEIDAQRDKIMKFVEAQGWGQKFDNFAPKKALPKTMTFPQVRELAVAMEEKNDKGDLAATPTQDVLDRTVKAQTQLVRNRWTKFNKGYEVLFRMREFLESVKQVEAYKSWEAVEDYRVDKANRKKMEVAHADALQRAGERRVAKAARQEQNRQWAHEDKLKRWDYTFQLRQAQINNQGNDYGYGDGWGRWGRYARRRGGRRGGGSRGGRGGGRR